MAEPSEDEQAAYHRQTAVTIRRLASQIQFDLLRRRQLLALAEAFDRLADQIASRGIREAAFEGGMVASKADGGTTMQVHRTKRAALKAAATILRDPAAEVEVGPMLDTREGILRGEELRRVIGGLTIEV